LATAPICHYSGARSRRQSLPLGRARAPSRVLGRTIPGALDMCSPRSSRLRQCLVADDSTGRAISRHHARGRIDDSTLWEAHGYGCHFGASDRALAVSASQGHTWAWRIVIFVIAGRLSGPCDLHRGAPCAHSVRTVLYAEMRVCLGLVCACLWVAGGPPGTTVTVWRVRKQQCRSRAVEPPETRARARDRCLGVLVGM